MAASAIIRSGVSRHLQVAEIRYRFDRGVEQDPKAIREGHDPQLEKAVEVVMQALKKNRIPKHTHPPFPDYYSPKPRTLDIRP
jgi:hypothetical protein